MPVRMRIGANRSRSSSMTSSCLRSRSGDSPLAIVSRGEWSVSAQYSWPSDCAVAIISSIGAEPSDQFECRCRSPRSAARISPPPRSSAAERNSTRTSGSRPAQACAITFAVFGPMPGQRLPAVGLAVPLALRVVEAPRRRRRRCGRPSPGASPRARGPCSTRSDAARRPGPWLQCAQR